MTLLMVKRQVHVPNLTKVKGQSHKIKKKSRYSQKGLVTRNTIVKYQYPSTYHSKVIDKVESFDGERTK